MFGSIPKEDVLAISVDPETAKLKARVALVHLMNLNLRLLEMWRQMQVQLTGAALDSESTLILMSIIATGAERLLRSGQLTNFGDLAVPVETSRLRRCNLSSIAATTGLNRELVRRRIIELERKGLVERLSGGGVRIPATVLQEPSMRAAIEHQLHALAVTADRLEKEGILRGAAPDARPWSYAEDSPLGR